MMSASRSVARATAPVPRATAPAARATALGRLAVCAVLLLAVAAVSGAPAASQDATPADAPSFELTAHRGTIGGFADHVSAADGDTVCLFVTTPAPTFDAEVYRLGWYANGERSGDLVLALRGLAGVLQPDPLVDADTGLISATTWSSTTSFTVDGWRTGLYLVKLIAADGDQAYVPLVVRDDDGAHDLLFEHASATDQAYNAWGGKSLYDFNSSGAPTVSGSAAAVKVSFDRPFDGTGAGGSLRWELNMVRWLEANGFDVGYVSDLDVHRDPAFAARARAVVQAGHNEYWSRDMRDHLEAARAQGKGLGFFTGDTGAWAVRFEESPFGKDRVEVGYKLAADPITRSDPSLSTGHWRDAPLNRPTQQFIGVGSGMAVRRSGDWVVEGADVAPDLFDGTGLRNGDVVRNLVGYEYDGAGTPGAQPRDPPGLQILGRARVLPLTKFDTTLHFNVAYHLPRAELAPVGRLTTSIETLAASPSWVVVVHLVGDERSLYLVYSPGPVRDSPRRYTANGESYGSFSVGEQYWEPGWRPLDRDLVADYAQAFGTTPDGVRVSSITLRGTLALGPVSLAGPTGSIDKTISLGSAPSPQAAGWRVEQGEGDLSVKPTADGTDTALVMQVALAPNRRPDEAHTVVMRDGGRLGVVAVGSIQWSWALDDLPFLGPHADTQGNTIEADARVQALTRNLLRALSGLPAQPR